MYSKTKETLGFTKGKPVFLTYREIIFIDISDIQDEFQRSKIHQALLNNEVKNWAACLFLAIKNIPDVSLSNL